MQYEWQCETCKVSTEISRPMADHAIPPDPEVKCLCGEPKWKRVLSAPSIVGKASFLDGQRKFHGLRESHDAQREMNTTRDSKKKLELAKEIKRIGVRVSKD